jgi:hypothetical protein
MAFIKVESLVHPVTFLLLITLRLLLLMFLRYRNQNSERSRKFSKISELVNGSDPDLKKKEKEKVTAP